MVTKYFIFKNHEQTYMTVIYRASIYMVPLKNKNFKIQMIKVNRIIEKIHKICKVTYKL